MPRRNCVRLIMIPLQVRRQKRHIQVEGELDDTAYGYERRYRIAAEKRRFTKPKDTKCAEKRSTVIQRLE